MSFKRRSRFVEYPGIDKHNNYARKSNSSRNKDLLKLYTGLIQYLPAEAIMQLKETFATKRKISIKPLQRSKHYVAMDEDSLSPPYTEAPDEPFILQPVPIERKRKSKSLNPPSLKLPSYDEFCDAAYLDRAGLDPTDDNGYGDRYGERDDDNALSM